MGWVLTRGDPETFDWCESLLDDAVRREPGRGALYILYGHLAFVREERPEAVLTHWGKGLDMTPTERVATVWLEKFVERFGENQPGFERFR